VQDGVIRNLQTLAESSQRLSSEIKATEPQIPWRELAGFRNVQRLDWRQAELVKFAQRDLIHHTRLVQPLGRVMSGFKDRRF
jgi:uncharacterized protein with HEPN domain